MNDMDGKEAREGQKVICLNLSFQHGRRKLLRGVITKVNKKTVTVMPRGSKYEMIRLPEEFYIL